MTPPGDSTDELLEALDAMIQGGAPAAPTSSEAAVENADPSTGPIGIDFDAVLPAINYAVTVAGIPVLRRLEIRNRTSEAFTSLLVQARIHCDALGQSVATFSSGMIDLAAGDGLLLENVKLQVDPGALVRLEEAVPAECIVEVIREGQQVARRALPTRLLAFNEFFNRRGMTELVAAHVLPNDPAIVPILQVAGDILRDETGDSSLEGYQSGADRAVLIGGAVYEALRRAGIGYINPPASFEGTGQKIRTPDQVINDRLGTCLDLACAYAACLEQAGLHPLVYLIKGHAYAGFWKDGDHGLTVASMSDRDAAVNLQDAELVVPVEATDFTSGKAKTFADARAEALHHLDVEEAFESLVDIQRARNAGVLPLPVRAIRDGAVTVVVQAVAPVAPSAERASPGTISTPSVEPDRTPARMRKWKEGLLDLSLRNPLLNLKVGRQSLGLLIPGGALGRVEDLLMKGLPLNLVASDELTELHRQRGARSAADIGAEERLGMLLSDRVMFADADRQELRKRCKALLDKARAAEEENGTNILHVVLGSLHWTDPKAGRAARSPLLLLPARLRSAGRGKPMELVADPAGGTTNNYCLLHKLKVTFNLHVPELEQLESDDAGVDVPKAIAALRRAIADQKLDMRVDEDAAIALLQFGKFRMWKDLNDHWEVFLKHPVIQHFVERAGQTFQDDVPPVARDEIDHAEVYCPIPSDGAQRQAIIAAARGASFVLEGPPGTGKSQTITNLVANAMAAGKRVLFVAEKRAALNIVKNRLSAVGLGPFCLDIHGKGMSAKELREQLAKSLDFHTSVDMGQWEAQRAQLAQGAERLRAYTTALHEPGRLGLSAWDAHQRILQLGVGHVATLDPAGARDTSLITSAVRAAAGLPEIAAASGTIVRHRWGAVDSSKQGDAIDAARLRDAVLQLGRVQEVVTHEPEPTRALLDVVRSVDEMRALHRSIIDLLPPAPVAGQPPVEPTAATTDALRLARQASVKLEQLLAVAQPVRAVFDASVFDLDIEARIAEIRSAQQAFCLVRGKRVRQALVPLQSHRRTDARDTTADDVVALLERATRCVRQGRDLATSVTKAAGSADSSWSPWNIDAGDSLAAILAALEARAAEESRSATAARDAAEARAAEEARAAAVSKVPAHVRAWFDAGPPVERALEVIGLLADAWDALVRTLGANDAEWKRWAGDRPLSVLWSDYYVEWSRDAATAGVLGLRRWIDLLRVVERIAAAGFQDVLPALLEGRLLPTAVHAAVGRGVARAALEERLSQPVLSAFDGLAHARAVRAFQELQGADAEGLKGVVPFRLLATRPFKQGQRFGEVGELARNELQKQRGGLAIRALIKKYARAIGELAPCFLMSPDSVAQFLAPGVIPFDLVVFDEASQVRVSEAIGAIARGKSLVVVGDSRQMPPTAFFGSGAGGDADIPPDMVVQDGPDDLESVLTECVGSGLPSLWLSWHYRSQEESLIAFSNAHYYEGRLASFPAPAQAAVRCGLHWNYVADGIFDRGGTRTNKAEAAAIVSQIVARMQDPELRKLSIGVVTLNLEQQELVESMLEDAAAGSAALDAAINEEDVDKRLFVKNLESVQGDERDVIMLSVGFGLDRTGKMTMNFGPLNRVGGERRLNVAITRARRELAVFASIEPEMIDVDRVSIGAVGVHHLRKFLEMARDGARRLTTGGQDSAAHDLHREEIAAALREAGLVVNTNIGLSSFRIDLSLAESADPSCQLVAVLLDGPSYASRPTVQDREALPSSVLEGLMRWPATLRIWLPEWLVERERIITAALDLVAKSRESLRLQAQQEADIRAAEAAAPPARPSRRTQKVAADESPRDEGTDASDDIAGALERLVGESAQVDDEGANWTPGDASVEGPASEDGDLMEALETLVGASDNEPDGDDAASGEAKGGREETGAASPAGSNDIMDELSRLVGESADPAQVPAETAPPAQKPDVPDIEAPHEAVVARPVSVDLNVVHRDPEDEDFAPFESESVAGSPDDLETAATDAAAAARVRSVVNAIVDVEGPVAVDRLAVLVARQFGLSRVRKERMEQVVRLIPAARQRPSDFGRFVWPASRNPESWRGFRRTPEDCDRSVDAIPPEEIRNAMVYFATRGMSISEESVLEELCEVFQIGRMSAAIRTRLLGVLAWALQRGELHREGDRIVPRKQ